MFNFALWSRSCSPVIRPGHGGCALTVTNPSRGGRTPPLRRLSAPFHSRMHMPRRLLAPTLRAAIHGPPTPSSMQAEEMEWTVDRLITGEQDWRWSGWWTSRL